MEIQGPTLIVVILIRLDILSVAINNLSTKHFYYKIDIMPSILSVL